MLKAGQLVDGRADPAEPGPGQFLGRHQAVVLGRVRVGVPLAPLQVHPDADQALGDAVVQVAGDPVPLGRQRLGLPDPGQLLPGPPELVIAPGHLVGPALGVVPAGQRALEVRVAVPRQRA